MVNLAIWRDPFSLTARVGRMMDQFFQDFGTWTDLEAFAGFGHSDVYVKGKKLIIETELPGVERDDVQVKVEEGRLVISGEIKRSEEVRNEDYICMGRRYGAFRRVFPLPPEAEDKKGIKARFDKGVLTVEVPLKRAPEAEDVFEVKVE